MSVANIRIQRSVETVANATELATRVIKELTGKDISDSLNNNPLTLDGLRALIVSRIQYNAEKMTATQL